ncbi:hypothetical protein BKA65DRAFT_591843 [Rhexocercosporidium sp. MPI-PUGE-AT-0058]|nr:hypothetical protein BKA65DRAFT_591843 [Rhexocercosporidium sp. MPI-PUGE-AT-0058]
MLSFQKLPAEILLIIAQCLGGVYLLAQVDRILLCKAWYSVTQSVAWEVINLSINNFERFSRAPTDIQHFIRSRVKDLSISGSYDTNVTFQTQNSETGTQETWRVAKLRSLLQAHNTTLCTSLKDFSTITLPQMQRLHTFALKISSESTIYTETDSTWTDTLRNLVTSLPNTLTSLTIDKLGVTSRFSTGARDPHTVCKVVLAKTTLPSLKHLRLRLHCICPSLFATKTIQSHATLETLVVALDAYSPQLGMVHHAHRCTQPQQSSQRLYDDMVDAAEGAVKAGCFPALKKARILRYDVQELLFHSLDVLSGVMGRLPEGVGFDDVDWEDKLEWLVIWEDL